MLNAENVAILKDWADEVARLDVDRAVAAAGRDVAIRAALAMAGVGEVVTVTGLTRARIYQIRDGK